MHRIRQSELPLRGSSHNFVGADQGGVDVSVVGTTNAHTVSAANPRVSREALERGALTRDGTWLK
jgi:hypothetical protein